MGGICISKDFSVIKVSYSNSDDLITINQPKESVAKYVSQCGGESFAVVKYLIEPFESNHPIVFVNEATIEPCYGNLDEMNANFQKYCEAVMSGIQLSAENFYIERQRKIGKIKITLLELLMHPSDSKESAYKAVGIIIIHDNFGLNKR